MRLVKLTSEQGETVLVDAEKLVEIMSGKNINGETGTYVTLAGYSKARWVREKLEEVQQKLEASE
jgi:hypothetical protein